MKYNICVVGLGYVGLPLAVLLSKKYKVIGYDINIDRVNELRSGFDKTLEISNEELNHANENIHYITSIDKADDSNIYIVTVPTPIDGTNRPDLSPLIQASRSVGSVLKMDDIVIYESTVYPGVTEDTCVPVLEAESGLVFNRDFYCGYSPERINPGDKVNTLQNVIKVTSGSTEEVATQVDEIYSSVIPAGTHLVSSIKVAEASKVIENTQRDVNIALMNELSLIFDVMNIDTQEVIDAAATKWNFIKFTPGLVGGHCIGVDPYYLTFKAEELGYKPDLILAARQINNLMAGHIVEKTIKEMILSGSTVLGSDVLIMGVSFKEDCPDMRNTKVVDVIEGLKEFGVNIDVYDPWIDVSKESDWYKHGCIADPFSASKKYDAIIIAVAHSEFRKIQKNTFKNISKKELVLIDVKGIYKESTWSL